MDGRCASIAVVGLACRYPEAGDPASLLDLVVTGRRAFRRIPPCRLDLGDYHSPDPRAPEATFCTRAALLEGWRFDHAAFGVTGQAHRSADPARWLALETAARALAAAGFAGGTGLPGDSAGVFVGNTLCGDVSRASLLRLRWPYARRAIAGAMRAAEVPGDLARRVLQAAAAGYLAPLPPVTELTYSGAMPATIATSVCRQFGFRGGGRVIDAGGASSLAAVASACLALASGELDVALAGGVELSLDPLDLVGLAKAGLLAADQMRVYDERPTGFLPGEGCGMTVLMRAADARAAGLPVHAEILGWGIASPGAPAAGGQEPAAAPGGPDRSGPGALAAPHQAAAAGPGSQLLAMRRAYQMARIDPADVQLIEGCGAGLSEADEAELAALAALRAGRAGKVAALGSITASIGNSRAAAGAAGLIKAVLALENGVVPPSTGTQTPHPMLRDGHARLRLPDAPESWPDGTRHAAVGALGPDGLAVHVVLRGPAGGRPPAPAPAGRLRRLRLPRRAAAGSPVPGSGAGRPGGPARPGTYVAGPGRPVAYLFHAGDRRALSALMTRVARLALWLSDGQLQDLAVWLAGGAAGAGPVRVAIVADRQDGLARAATEAAEWLPALTGGVVGVRDGMFAADGTGGRVTLLLGAGQEPADQPERALERILGTLRWLARLGVRPEAAVGRGIGGLAGLAWAGCLGAEPARRLGTAWARALSAPAGAAPGLLSGAIEEFSRAGFGPPARRLILASTGAEVAAPGAIGEILGAELLAARIARGDLTGPSAAAPQVAAGIGTAVRAGAAGASLLLQVGDDDGLAAAARRTAVPLVEARLDDFRGSMLTAAALFAAGAAGSPSALYEGWPARPVDLAHEPSFIVNPCQARPGPGVGTPAAGRAEPPGPARPEPAGGTRAMARGTGGAARQPADGQRDPLRGVAPWARCWAECPVEPPLPVPPAVAGPWRVHVAAGGRARAVIAALARHDPAASRALAVLDPGDGRAARAAAAAARDAVATGQLVVISPGPGLTGLWASLHAEHPRIGITVIRAPLTRAGLAAAAAVASAEPGCFRELIVGEAGQLREAAAVPVPLPGGAPFPLSEEDVVLVSSSAGTAVQALAQVAACSGAAIAIIGPARQGRDHELTAEAERLQGAGARICHEVVDLARPADVVAALRRIERAFGPVTVLGHAVRPAPGRAVAELTEAGLSGAIGEQLAALNQVAAALRARAGAGGPGIGGLRLVVTFGSVAGRYGMAGQGILAAVTGALAARGEQLAAPVPGCRALHVDWPGWAGTGDGARPSPGGAGSDSLETAEASRLLLKILSTPGLPGRLAVHGRAGVPPPWPVALSGQARRAPAPGRFTGEVLVHYPGAELITQASLSLRTDPYLDDYRMDGVPVLPAAMALEAMAQAASALAGAPARAVSGFSAGAPIVLPDGAAGAALQLRVCALREGDAVTAVIRTDRTGFAVDHFRARFTCATDRGDRTTRPGAAGRPAPRGPDGSALAGAPAGGAAPLYGPVCFQAGRFRRIAAFRLAGARSATALARGADEVPWFGAPDAAAAAAWQSLVLGSPGVTDAVLQLVQACLPHRRVLPSGCESVVFSGRPATGQVTLRVAQAAADPPGASPPAGDAPAATARAGAGAAADPVGGETIWDAEVADAAGQALVTWRGLRMRDAGPLPRDDPWPAALLACYLERAAAELGLGPGLEVRLGDPGSRADPEREAGREPSRRDRAAGSTAPPGRSHLARGRGAGGGEPAEDGRSGDFGLVVRAPVPAACAWRFVQPDPAPATPRAAPAGGARSPAADQALLAVVESAQRAEPGLAAPAYGRLASADPGSAAAAAAAAARARAATLAACLGGAVPADVTVRTRILSGTGWLLLATGEASIASVLVTVAGLPHPVAIAIMTGVPGPARGAPRGPAPRPGRAGARERVQHPAPAGAVPAPRADAGGSSGRPAAARHPASAAPPAPAEPRAGSAPPVPSKRRG